MSTQKLSPRKPRNPFVALGRARAAGAHRRGSSSQRQAAKRALRALRAELDHKHSP
jgi:hypothetical protein